MRHTVRDVLKFFALLAALSVPASAATVDPSGPGPFAVGVTTLTLVDAVRGRTLVTEVWYPADTAGRDTPVRRGRYTLILLAHGNCGFRTNYEYLTIPLASFGFVVAAPDFPGFNKTDCDAGVPPGDVVNDPPRDLSFLRVTLRDPAGPGGQFANHLRRKRAGLVGHSLGGLAVVNASLADPAFTAVVGLAPLATATQGAAFNGLRPRRAVMVIGGSADATLPFDVFAAPFFAALPPPAFLAEIIGGTHSGLTDMDSNLAPEQLARQEALARRYAIAFLERYAARRRRYKLFLTPEDAAAQGTDVELTARPQ